MTLNKYISGMERQSPKARFSKFSTPDKSTDCKFTQPSNAPSFTMRRCPVCAKLVSARQSKKDSTPTVKPLNNTSVSFAAPLNSLSGTIVMSSGNTARVTLRQPLNAPSPTITPMLVFSQTDSNPVQSAKAYGSISFTAEKSKSDIAVSAKAYLPTLVGATLMFNFSKPLR